MKAEESLEAYKKRLEEIKQEFIKKYQSTVNPKPGDYVRAWVGAVVNVKTQCFGKVERIDEEGQYVLQDGQTFPYAKVITKEDFERVKSI